MCHLRRTARVLTTNTTVQALCHAAAAKTRLDAACTAPTQFKVQDRVLQVAPCVWGGLPLSLWPPNGIGA